MQSHSVAPSLRWTVPSEYNGGSALMLNMLLFCAAKTIETRLQGSSSRSQLGQKGRPGQNVMRGRIGLRTGQDVIRGRIGRHT